ncbi:cbb3-type cytochrome c oxidase N-terminal domain-containing protein [Verrucomicrobiaceae bacterium 227]
MENQTPHETPRRSDYATKPGEVILRKHEFDGIQEYDQKLPNWWLFTLYSAIIFFIVAWVVYYQTSLVKTDQQSVTSAMMTIQTQKKDLLEKTLASLTDEVLVNEWATDASIVASGQEFYTKVCLSCHGPALDAPQKLGLSLVDGTWKYGSNPMEIFKLINEGTPAESKGMEPTGMRMPPWGASYSPTEIAQVTAYLISMNPKDFEALKK